jgi:hypothetical protein
VTRLFVLRLFVVVLTVASFAARAQSLTRIRATITALDGNVLLLKTRGEGKDMRLQLAPDTTVG